MEGVDRQKMVSLKAEPCLSKWCALMYDVDKTYFVIIILITSSICAKLVVVYFFSL